MSSVNCSHHLPLLLAVECLSVPFVLQQGACTHPGRAPQPGTGTFPLPPPPTPAALAPPHLFTKWGERRGNYFFVNPKTKRLGKEEPSDITGELEDLCKKSLNTMKPG